MPHHWKKYVRLNAMPLSSNASSGLSCRKKTSTQMSRSFPSHTHSFDGPGRGFGSSVSCRKYNRWAQRNTNVCASPSLSPLQLVGLTGKAAQGRVKCVLDIQGHPATTYLVQSITMFHLVHIRSSHSQHAHYIASRAASPSSRKGSTGEWTVTTSSLKPTIWLPHHALKWTYVTSVHFHRSVYTTSL